MNIFETNPYNFKSVKSIVTFLLLLSFNGVLFFNNETRKFGNVSAIVKNRKYTIQIDDFFLLL